MWLIKLEDVLIRFEILKGTWDVPSKTDLIHI